MLGGIITAILLLLFIGGWIYVWSPRRRDEFDAAARLPLDDQQQPDDPRERNDRS
ncbi:MAG: cbb3-type cytochrome c oxidase subunit 3 [Pseudoxanthomonas suwonensis]|nr:cbb3-type cytochrome c oxidase subunit 3 [Pseudoxanthomonas suwonensis]